MFGAGPAGAAGPTSDPESERQWGLTDIKAPQAWAKGRGRGIDVAVVSSGVARHPDLAGKTIGGFDATGSDPNTDSDGRGTHLAGIVGAATDNGEGIAAVAPAARIVPYKAFEDDGAVDAAKFIAALRQAGTSRHHVVLVDVPSGFPSESMGELRRVLQSLGPGQSVVVGARSSLDLSGLPVLAVAATSSSGGQATNAGVDARGVGAPGEATVSTTVSPGLLGAEPDYGYGEQSGTSQAAAHAAGAVAILRGLNANPTQAADTLRTTARKSPDASLGAGIIDLAAAANGLRPPGPTPPPSTTTTTTKAGTTSTTKGPGGAGVTIPGQPLDTGGFTGPPGSELLEEGEENAVLPEGVEDFLDAGDEGGGRSMLVSEEDDRPLGMLAIGFGLLCGVGTGLSLTLRRLAGLPA